MDTRSGTSTDAGDARSGSGEMPAATPTVVIPAYGPGPHLERVVEALRRQTVPVGPIIISHSGRVTPPPALRRSTVSTFFIRSSGSMPARRATAGLRLPRQTGWRS